MGAKSLAPAAPQLGEVVGDKFRVEAVLGEGGMGTVFAAHHVLLDQYVAVKLLSPELARQESVVARFLREAKAAARLRSEHVARIMDVGSLPGGQPYIVMELLEGEDLEQRLTRAGPLPTSDAVDFILHALEAMAHAHAEGIVHRDLKPANLFVVNTPDRGEIVKVLDFGIAKLAEGSSAAAADGRAGVLTGEHALGSPSYMAPEQVRASRTLDARADIWALGAILYELLTHKTAFDGATVGEIFANVLQESPRPVQELRTDVPPEVAAFITRCLEKRPDQRFPDVAAAARAIAPFGSGKFASYPARIEQTLEHVGKTSDPDRSWRRNSYPDDGRTPPPGPSSRRLPVPALAATVPGVTVPRRRRHTWVAFGGVTFGAVVAGVALAAVLRRSHAHAWPQIDVPAPPPPMAAAVQPEPSAVASEAAAAPSASALVSAAAGAPPSPKAPQRRGAGGGGTARPAPRPAPTQQPAPPGRCRAL